MECCEHLQVGQKVQDFQAQALLADGSFKDVKLADYKGKWLVVFFYPLDFTFVCPTEIQSFNKLYGEFKKLGAEVIASSTDSVYSHKAWVESALGKVKFPMLGDTGHQVARTFNVLVEDKGIALRGTFIIDPSGTLRSAVVNDLAVGRSVEETVRTLQAFQTGKLTGCGWKPGEKTLN
ncbi:MAG: thioredoxin peroxidase [Candidatus Omnitrophica bacterium CG1_02_49_16]|nr:MAG: thioredoxin peroxidase [Candidatus Omnitrophica bacterium CG1_02_49_16]